MPLDAELSKLAVDTFQDAMRGKWRFVKQANEVSVFREDVTHAVEAAVEAVLRQVQSITHECKCSQAQTKH
jgi:hypothetical protein